MAVEAHQLKLFPPQLIPNRREILTNPMDTSMYNVETGGNYSMVLPLSGIAATTVASETLLPPPYNSISQKATAMKSDNSTLTYNNFVPIPRKRSRDSIHNNSYYFPSYHKNTDTFSFLGQDISYHINRQQIDLDNLISQHMDSVRLELEEKRKRQARRIMEAIEVGMIKRLKAKEEEIMKIEKVNWVLEEKVKSLCIENQIWRDLAQTNEATANALRSNLEQLLAQVGIDATVAGTAVEEDAESCCGSSDEGWHTVATEAQDKEGEGTSIEVKRVNNNNNNNNNNNIKGNEKGSEKRRMCRKCGKEESCVLILPCRHLCLCTVCGSTLHTCPVCKSFKNASVHVNMTS